MDKSANELHVATRDTRTEDFAVKQSGFNQPPIQTLSSAALFAGAKELVIAHGGQEYRLRQTSQGKLILTK